MSNIRILPETLANQIAAGEVIERPASVVKELVENGIDAGASRISIQIEGNGTRLIRVIDNGRGMDQDDVLLSLERHATSKIASIEELGAIRSLGFRGEAVPSIASVCRLRIISRLGSEPLGTQVDVRFGKLVKVHDMGCSPGTTFEVADLFGNVPARKKFLKSTKTELAHIEEVVRNYALVCPDIGFSYLVGGKAVFELPVASSGPAERVEQVLGRNKSPLISIAEQGPEEIGIAGFLVPPDAEVAAAARLRTFVNGRMVRDRMIGHAVAEGLQNYLMRGRRPVGVFYLTVPPESVDVNVHPTKQEVRFHRGNVVHDAIARAVRAAMTDYQAKLREDIFRPKPAPAQVAIPPEPRPQEYAPGKSPGQTLREPAPLFAAESAVRPEVVPAVERGNAPRPAADAALPAAGSAPERPLAPGGQAGAVSEGQSLGFVRYLGQVLNTYLLCETDHGLLAIDQHAAHERLLFENLKRQFAARTVARQSLLFPKVVECSLEEIQILEQYGDEIGALGLAIEDFGGGSFVIKAVPAIVGRSAPEEILAGVLARFSEDTSRREGVRAEAVLSDMACKAAIKAGQSLEAAEVEALLAEMMGADIFSHCPHGRPVAKQFLGSDIKKWFYRG